MGIKLGNSVKLPGDTLIGTGIVFCGLSVLLFIMGSVNGATNGYILGGGGILGLLIICVGYLKRIAVMLTASTQFAVTVPDAKR